VRLALYGTAFFIATFKFMFSSSVMIGISDLTYWEVAISTALGALFSFNLFFFFSGYLMHTFRRRVIIGKSVIRKPKIFTKTNKRLVRMKISPHALWLICTLVPIFGSVPVGGVVVAKFYRRNRMAFYIANGTLVICAFLFAAISFGLLSIFAS
jgi:hypothetical protein